MQVQSDCQLCLQLRTKHSEPETRNWKLSARLRLLHFLNKRRHDVEQVPHNRVIRNLENWRFRIFVHRDNRPRSLHAHNVLNRAADAQREIVEGAGESKSPEERVGHTPAVDSGPTLHFGDVVVDLETRTVTRAGEPVQLTHLEFELLSFFCRGGRRVYSREHLLREVWGLRQAGQARTVDNFMAQLRAKLEVDPERPRHLLTVRGSGYRFVPE